jgi:hypothetical protein
VDTAAGFRFAWSVTRNGTPYLSGSGPALTFTPEEGRYVVALAATDEDGGTTVDTRSFSVSDPAVAATGGFTVAAVEGADSGLQTVATFTDPGGAEPLADYAATVAWGDGTTSAGTITFANGAFTVQGRHAYAEEGTFSVTVTVGHEQAAPAVTTSRAVVADAPLSAIAAGVSPVAGAPFSGVLATFTDADPAGAVSDYTATIVWGDGSTSPAVVTANRRGGFDVSGANTYAAAGAYTFSVQIADAGGQTVLAPGTAQVQHLGRRVDDDQVKEVDFWEDRSGQALIRSFNGGPGATALGNWLAATFANLYGTAAGANNLAGKTNAQVADFYRALSEGHDDHGRDLAAQVLATALNLYATTLSLGGTSARAYGFRVDSSGLGAASYNIGASGAAFGAPNRTTLNVYQVLQATNRQARNGVLYGGDRDLVRQAYRVFAGINEGRDDDGGDR